MILAHKNRIEVQQPRGRSGWCDGCDSFKIRDGQKCPVCGYRETNRAKKAGPMIDYEAMIRDVAANSGEYSFKTVKGKVQDVHHIKPKRVII